jgi:hypothetical protein
MTISQESYELCELENSNLRRCLAWAGRHLTADQRAELAIMIGSRMEDGGVTTGDEEAQWQYQKEIQQLCVRAAELLNKAVSLVHTGPNLVESLDRINWFTHADQVANMLMEFDPPEPAASLAVITNAEEATK